MRYLILIALLVSGCSGALRGGVIDTNKPQRFIALRVTDVATQRPILDVTGRLFAADGSTTLCKVTDDFVSRQRLVCVFTSMAAGYILLHAPGYEETRVDFPPITELAQTSATMRSDK